MTTTQELRELFAKIKADEDAKDERLEGLAGQAEDSGSFYRYDEARTDSWEESADRLARLIRAIDESGLLAPVPDPPEPVIQPTDGGRIELRCPECGGRDIRVQDSSTRSHQMEIEADEHGIAAGVIQEDSDFQTDGLICWGCMTGLAVPDVVELVWS